MSRTTSIRLFLLHSLLARLYFYLPVIVLWFRSQGLSQFQVMVLLSVFFLSATLSEIPTGIFSDRFGHKWAMTLCGVCQAIGVTLLAFSSILTLAIIGEILMGIGQAFYTGAKEAYLFNYLKEEGQEGEYQKDYGQSKFFEFVGMALGALIGGSIYVWWGRLPFFLSAFFFILASVIASSLHQPPHFERKTSTFSQLALGIREIRSSSAELKILILYYCLMMTSILVFVVALNQPFLKEVGMPLPYFGVVFLFFHVAAMGGSLLARKIPQELLNRSFFFLVAAGFLLITVLLAQSAHPSSFLLVGILYLIWGFFIPTTSHAVNRLIPSETRATILSAQDFLQNLLFVVLAPVLGLIADRSGVTASLWALGGISLFTAALTVRLR